MRTFSRIFASGALAVTLAFLPACNLLPEPQADTVRYFTLASPAGAGGGAAGAVVRPVQVAGHLRGRVMAVRIAENEVSYVDEVRWAESLDAGITQLLRNRLRDSGAGCVVTVEVQRCEAVRADGNQLQFAATYAMARPGTGADVITRGTFMASPRQWDGRDYGVLVGLMRDAVGELGDALAAALGEKK